MKNQVNISPYTNFEDVYTYLKCPAKLYLKLVGCKSEVETKYTPPSVSPALLGRKGEERIKQAFERKLNVNVPNVVAKKLKPSKGKLEKILTEARNTIANNIRIQLSRIHDIEIKYSPLILSEEARKLKKDFKVYAIISKVNFTTIPHHRIGQIDFIGLKENREIVVIEVKNKKENLNEKDKLQLEYYIDCLPKHYNYTKFYSHLDEIACQLYPKRYHEYVKIARSFDLLEEEMYDSHNIMEDVIMKLNDVEREKFQSIYKANDEYEAIEKFLMTIPEYIELIKTLETYNKKLSSLTDEFKSATDLIAELMEKDVKDGILVDIRRSKVVEIEKTINFDKIVKGVWKVKKSMFYNKRIAPKRTEECRYCRYRNICEKILRDEELEECKSITSIVHKGFDNLNLKVREPEIEIPKSFIVMEPEVITDLSTEKLLKKALKGTEWKYIPELANKRGWKHLYADAVASNKLKKEFSFWRL